MLHTHLVTLVGQVVQPHTVVHVGLRSPGLTSISVTLLSLGPLPPIPPPFNTDIRLLLKSPFNVMFQQRVSLVQSFA